MSAPWRPHVETTEPHLYDAEVECPECGRIFDLLNPDDASDYEYGHDCEVT
jgi:hypothetical protein